jgi:histone H3/H4
MSPITFTEDETREIATQAVARAMRTAFDQIAAFSKHGALMAVDLNRVYVDTYFSAFAWDATESAIAAKRELTHEVAIAPIS